MIIVGSITQAYRVSWDHLNDLSTPPDLFTKIFNPAVDTPSYLPSLSRLKIVVANLAVVVIFAIPIIQSIALSILLNQREELVRKKLQEDPLLNSHHADALVEKFIKSTPRVHIHQESLNKSLQTFVTSYKQSIKEQVIAKIHKEEFPTAPFRSNDLVSKITEKDLSSLSRTDLEKKIQAFFKEQMHLMKDCLEVELSGRDCQRIDYKGPLAHFTPENLSSLQNSFHKDYLTFFNWVKKHCAESIDELSKRTDTPVSLFTSFFLENLSKIHSSSILYERYQTLYPNTFSDENFSLLYSKWNTPSEQEKTASTFLQERAKKDEERLFAFLWRNRRNLKALDIRSFFYPPKEIQAKINLFTFEYRSVCEFLNRYGTPSEAETAWTCARKGSELISQPRLKELLVEIFYYGRAISQKMYEKGENLATFDYIKEEISQFESQQTMTLNQFLEDLEIRLEIKKKLEKWKKKVPKHEYVSRLIEYHSKLVASDYSPNQLKPLIEEMNRETLFHLVALETSPIPVKNLDPRGKEILRVCRIIREFIDKESFQKVIDARSGKDFLILTKEEISHLLYLACTCLLTRKSLMRNIGISKNQDSAISRKSRAGRSLASRHIKADDITQILERIRQLLAVHFPDLFPHDPIVRTDIDSFRKHLIDANWSPPIHKQKT